MTRTLGRDAALAAAVTLAIVAVVSFAPAPQANRFDGDLHNVAHVLVFGILGLVLSRTLRGAFEARPSRALVALASLAAGVVFGAGTEYAQGFLGGMPSWGDVGRDTLGCAVGSCAAFALERGRSVIARRAFWAAAALGLLAGGWPLAATLLDYRERNALFPVLLDAGNPRSRSFSSAADPSMRVEPATSGPRRSDGTPDAAARPAIQIPLDQGRWPGLTLEEPVRDWRGWRALVVELANPTDAPLHIVVRVNDQAHDNEYYDRFNRGFDVPAGSQRRVEIPIIEIEQAPKNRRMDLTAIAKIVIFHEGPAPGRAFLVERVSLVR